MKRIIVPLFATLLVLVALTAALPASSAVTRTDEQVYNCEPIYYPDGTEGVAIVRVEMSSAVAAPTVIVTVEYYSEGRAHFLGSYVDWSSSSDFPTNGYEAEQFALEHFNDRG